MIRKTAFATLLLATTVGTVHAGGSLPFAGMGVALNNGATNLVNATQITTTSSIATSAGVGDYSGVPSETAFTGPTLDPSNLPTGLSTFSFSDDGFTFVSNSFNNQDTVTERTANVLAVYLRGNFNGVDPSVQLTASLNDSSVSKSWTSQTPAVSRLPEPGSAVMGLTSIFGGCLIHLLRRSRRSRKANV